MHKLIFRMFIPVLEYLLEILGSVQLKISKDLEFGLRSASIFQFKEFSSSFNGLNEPNCRYISSAGNKSKISFVVHRLRSNRNMMMRPRKLPRSRALARPPAVCFPYYKQTWPPKKLPM